MGGKPSVAIVGAGNLAGALAFSLRRAGYELEAVISRPGSASSKRARSLAREVGARAHAGPPPALHADVVWFCVPDAEIGRAAQSLVRGKATGKFPEPIEWKGKVALHSSGALTSDELAVLRERGAVVASVHPMMTFVRGARPSLGGVPFAVEGDPAAARLARRMVKDLGGRAYPIRKKDKAAYHAWGTFASPLLTTLLATTEQVAAAAGVSRKAARARMVPILLQTLANYAEVGAAAGFSGPIIRGDVDTVNRHLRVLHGKPAARAVYLALARAALQYLPAKNKNALKRVLDSRPG